MSQDLKAGCFTANEELLAPCLLLKEQQGQLRSVKIESGLLPDFREAKLLMHWQSELRE